MGEVEWGGEATGGVCEVGGEWGGEEVGGSGMEEVMEEG